MRRSKHWVRLAGSMRSALGLTVYALVPMQSIAPQKRQQLGQLFGYYGADSVVMLTSDAAGRKRAAVCAVCAGASASV